MNGGRVFLDTNVLVYAYDSSASSKHVKARQAVEELWNEERGLLSTQVLQEFFVQVTRKIPKPLEPRQAKVIVRDLLTWEVVVNDGNLILSAIELQLAHNFSFWDSMIIEAALRGGADLLFSEDLSHGQKIGPLTVVNPFREAR